MVDRIIDAANSKCSVLGKMKIGVWTVSPDDYNKKFKPAVYDVVMEGITNDDLVHMKGFIAGLIQGIEG